MAKASHHRLKPLFLCNKVRVCRDRLIESAHAYKLFIYDGDEIVRYLSELIACLHLFAFLEYAPSIILTGVVVKSQLYFFSKS